MDQSVGSSRIASSFARGRSQEVQNVADAGKMWWL